MIHEGEIDLDPEYQRGRYCTLIQGLYFVPLLIFIWGTATCSCSLVNYKADGYHRFTLPQLLRPTCRLCDLKRSTRRLRNEIMCRWKTTLNEYTKVL
jgi:hypothetical protein